MSARASTIETLRAIVARVVGPARAPAADVGPDTPLTEGGLWLDSVDLLEVIIACESEFAITFEPARDLLDETLATLGTLAARIDARSPRA